MPTLVCFLLTSAFMPHLLTALFRRRPAAPAVPQGQRRSRRRPAVIVALVFAGMALGGKVGLQLNLYSQVSGKTGTPEQRETLFQLLRPVTLANCQLERFGEPHDGGYLLCANLLEDVRAGYSYGISGYDQWGCDVSTKRRVPVHQYDCFNLTRPICPKGNMQFHEECVGASTAKEDGRVFDSMERQVARNGDSGKHIVLKIDVEGAEWGSFLTAPDELLKHVDQIAVEFHGIDEKSVAAVQRLKQFFEVAHIHYNNYTCYDGMAPFESWAYEVLFVNKRLAVRSPAVKAAGAHSADAPNTPLFSDCQPGSKGH